jgi:hypothetical protein
MWNHHQAHQRRNNEKVHQTHGLQVAQEVTQGGSPCRGRRGCNTVRIGHYAQLGPILVKPAP